MHRMGKEAKITKISGFLLVILSIFVLLAMSIQDGLVAEPTIMDNLDYSYTATWEFDDMMNYTLSNVTGANGEINLTKTSSYWNQSNAFDFAQGQSYNVIPGDGVISSADDLVMGILGNQNFTSDTYWEFQNSATDKVVSGWQAGEEGWLYCWIPENIPLIMTTLQPDGAAGLDSYINESDNTVNYGGNSEIIVGSNTTEQRGLFWFDVSSISNAKIVDAQLELYFYQSENASSANLSIHRVTNPWTEGDVSWQDRTLATPWGTPGGDFDAAALDTVTGLMDNYGWKFWNITSLVDGWVNGTITNEGVLLNFTQGDAERKYFYSSDYATASLRPKLNITYFTIETFNETANFSQDFDIQEQIAYIDTTEADFNSGVSSNITVTDENGGQIELNAGGTFKYDPLDNVTWWAEDPDTTTGKGSFTYNTAVKIEGTGSMQIDMDLSSTLQNYGVMRTAATYWNWSIYQELQFWVNSSGKGEVLKIIFEDTFGGSWQSSPMALTNSWEMKSFDLSTLPVNISRIEAIKFHLSDTISNITTYIDNITLSGGLPYDPEGTFISRVFDGGYALQWQQISWNATIPANTNMDIRTRTGNTSTPDGSWSVWSAIYAMASGSDITNPIGRYIQYQAYLNTSNILVSPVLSDVSLGKLKYNLTFTYSVDEFANITWARFYVELDGQVIWEDLLSGTQSANVVAFDISSYLTTISNYDIRFGLTVNSNSTWLSNITMVLDDIQIRTLFGQHTSNIFDVGTETTWTDINWDVVLPQDTNITLTTRTSSDNVSWSPWSSPYAFSKDNITSSAGRYIQYQLVFSRVVLGETPVFKWINISTSIYETQGMLTFNNDLTIINVTNWGTFSAVSILRGQSITYEFSVDSGSNWNAVPADGNLSFVSISTGKIRFRAIFETTDTSVTPSLCSMNLTYYVNRPPVIVGVVPNQSQGEDGGSWYLDLTSYESDFEDSNLKLRWSITGKNTSLYTVSGELSDDDNLTFTPLPNAWGSNMVTLWLEDSYGARTSQILWINVTPVNDKPSIQGAIPSFFKDEDAVNWNYDLSSYKFDIDNFSGELTWQIVGWDAVLFDSVSIAGDIISFDLAQDAFGNDEMTITLSDGLLTDTQNFWVNVTPMNDAPVISGIIPDQLKNEDDLAWTLDLTLLETDVEDTFPSASLSWSVTGVNSALISVGISDNNITFTPKPDANGNNEITIVLSDSGALSDPQTIWINITPDNDAPAIIGSIPSFDKNEDDGNWNYDLSGFKSDIDNLTSELTWQIAGWDPLLFDSVGIAGDVISFDLALNAFGNDEMTITLTDGLFSDSQNIWVNITPQNDAPTISGGIPDQPANEDDLSLTLDLTSFETDIEDIYPSASLSWSVTGVNASLVSVSVSDNNLTFTLVPDAFGNNEITIILTDSGGFTDSQKIWVNVTSSNDAPSIFGVIPSFEKGQNAPDWQLDLSIYKFDIDNSSSELTWSVAGWDAVLFDSVSIVGDIIYFDLALDTVGIDEMTIILSDGLQTDSQNIWVNVTSANNPPVILGTIPDQFKNEDDLSWTLDLTNLETDAEDSYPSPSLVWTVSGVNGSIFSVLITDNNLTFTLMSNAFGNDEITITLMDSGGSTDSQSIWVNVTPENDAPQIIAPIPDFSRNEDSPNWGFYLLAFKADVDNIPSELSWQVLGWDPLLFDSVGIVGDLLSFDLALNAFGNNEITITLSDGLLMDSRTFWVNVTPQNDAPVISGIIPDQNANEDDLAWTLDLTSFETDIEDISPSSGLSWSVSGLAPNPLTVTISDNNITFTLVPDTYGNEEFVIILTDSGGLTDTQSIWINVSAMNDAPEIFGVIPSFDRDEDAPDWTIDLSFYMFDVDNTPAELSWSVSGWSTTLFDSVIVAGDVLTFDLAANAYGDDEITLTLGDGFLFSSQNIWVNVTSVNDPPSILGTIPNVQKDEDSPQWTLDLTSYESDVEDGSPSPLLTWSVLNVNSSLINVTITDNILTFEVVPNASGDNYITIILTDSGSATDSQFILVRINPVNDAPIIQPSVANVVIAEDTNTSIGLLTYGNDIEDLQSNLRWYINGADTSLYSWQIDPATNMLYIEPLQDTFGTDDVTLVLMDTKGAQDIQSLQVIILPINDPPYILPGIPQSSFETLEDEPITLILTGYENDVDDTHDMLTWSVEGVDTAIISVSMDRVNDELVIVPIVEFPVNSTNSIETEITLVLTDFEGLEAKQNITVTLTPVNNAPLLCELPDIAIKFDKSYVFDLSPYIYDEDTPLGSLTIVTSEPTVDGGDGYISISGLNLTLLYPAAKVGDSMVVLVILSDGQLSSYSTFHVDITDNNPPERVSPLPDVDFDEDTTLLGAFDLDDYFTDQESVGLNYSFYPQYTIQQTDYVFVVIDLNNSVDFYSAIDWFGDQRITFRAEDGHGAFIEYTITATVNPINDPPVLFDIPDQSCKVGAQQILDLLPFVEDVDTQPSSLTFTIDSTFASVQGSSLVFFYDQPTKETVMVTVNDGLTQDSMIFEVSASNNLPPSIALIPKLIVRGGEVYLFSLRPYISDPDDEIEDIFVWTDSDFITINIYDNLLLQIDFPTNMTGEEEDVAVFFSDGQDSNLTIMHIKITDENIPKLINILPNIFFHEDTMLSNAINLNDYFENAKNYSFFGNNNIIITIENGAVNLSAAANWYGTETITFRGTSGEAFAEDTIDIVVRPVNDAPVILPIPNFEKQINEIWALNLLNYIHDIDTPNSELIVGVDNPHAVLYSFNLYFQSSQQTNDLIILTVSDSKSSVSTAFWVNVTKRNDPPLFLGQIRTAHIGVGETWSIDLDDYFFDINGDPLTFWSNDPNIVINPLTHEATWTPIKGDNTLQNVTFFASDGTDTVASSPIDIVIAKEESEPSVWESFWWVILLVAFIAAGLIAFAILTKRREKEEIEYEVDVDKAVKYLSRNGGNYLIKSENSDSAYKVFSNLLSIGFGALAITTKQTEPLVKQYNLGKAWIIKLTLTKERGTDGQQEETRMVGMLALGDEERRDDKYIFSSNFNSIVNAIEEFLLGGENKMVLMDGLEYILGADEMIKYVGFISSLREKLKMGNSCLLIPIDPKTLSEKELSLLERETVNLGETLHSMGKLKDAAEIVSSESDADAVQASASEETGDDPKGDKGQFW